LYHLIIAYILEVGLEVAKKKSVQENATKSDKHELTKGRS